MANVGERSVGDNLSYRIGLKEETRGLLKELVSLLCMESNWDKKKISLSIKRLSDGVDESDLFFEKRMASGAIQSSADSLTFDILPISENIETYKSPLMLISDENEIDEYIRRRIIKRRVNGFETFPVLVFCNDFFTVREGESFGYISIIESIEQACGDNCCAMAFKMSDLEKDTIYVKSYIDYLDMILHLKEAKECIEDVIEYIDNALERLRFVVTDSCYDDTTRLAAIAKAKSYLIFMNKLLGLNRKLDSLAPKVDGLIRDIRNKYDMHICGIRKNEPVKTASSMAVHIDLKYGTFKDQFLGFLSKVKKSSLYSNNDFLLRNTKDLVEETAKEINTNATELTLIGTFSSGKTTMINTFLGHRHKLHTSKNHNTAVLMQIKKKPDIDKTEFYEVVNKDKIIWSLVKPAYLETKLNRNPFSGRAKVISVRQTKQGYLVRLKEISGEKRIQDIRIGRMHRLCVSENAVIDGSSSLIVTDTSGKELQLASKNEVRLLIDYIFNSTLIHPKIKVSYRGGEKEYKENGVLVFLKKLCECEKYNQVSRDSRHPMVSAEHLSRLMGEDILFATFSADIMLDGKKVILDDAGWEGFCGSEEQGTLIGQKVPFCETPECYMLAEYINVFLDCEFLDYCSVNDTPGFGSITEEHDACTERFVSSSKSRLLAMITINSKSEDTKLYDFLNFIANVYQNFRKDSIDEVYFMLNCFSNNAEEKKLQSDIKKISTLIAELGFNKDNIYVCDLRKSTEESQEMLKMWGYPSYAAFRKECINNMLEAGLVSRFSWIYSAWKNYFQENLRFIDERLVILEENLENGINQIDAYKTRIRAVKNVKNPSIDNVLTEINSKYDEMFECIETTFRGSKKFSGFLWQKRERQEECIELINQLESLLSEGELDDYNDTIKNVVKDSLNELELASNIYFNIELNDATCTLFTLAIHNIKDKIIAADENTHWYDKKDQTNYYMDEISSIIEKDYKSSSERAKKYFEELNQVFINRKKQALHTLEEELRGIGNPELIMQQIKSYREMKEELGRVKKVFAKTINTDVIRSK